MPKGYSEQEREYIRGRLKEEAGKCLAQYGIRHTTVDEIVKRVKIPKGTFYLFYKSKELLLFEIVLEYHDIIESELTRAVAEVDPEKCTVEQLSQMICGFYKTAADNPILRMMNAEDIELLARKLPPEVLAEHLNDDNSMIEKVFAALKVREGTDLNAFSAAFRAIYFATLHKSEIGDESFDKALYLMVSGLVQQLM